MQTIFDDLETDLICEAEPSAEPRREIDSARDIEAFALAGNATFTLQGTKSRFTYRVAVCKDDPALWFVSVLTGADNETNYSYLGTIRAEEAGRRYRHGRKARIAETAPSAVAFDWFWRKLAGRKPLAPMTFWHEGRCGKCNRKLTVPESLIRGIGPECAAKGATAALPTFDLSAIVAELKAA